MGEEQDLGEVIEYTEHEDRREVTAERKETRGKRPKDGEGTNCE